jgi:hypothetical protein
MFMALDADLTRHRQFKYAQQQQMEQYKLPRETEKPVNVAYMTCASEFFSW